MGRGLVAAFVILVGFMPCALGGTRPLEPPVREGALSAAIERATSEGKPIVLFTRPARCRGATSDADPCRDLDAIVKHPAIQRRLARFVYVVAPVAGDVPNIWVLDRSGVAIVRWRIPHDALSFRQMLTLVDGAAPNLVGAARARARGDTTEAAREECLATLALGDEPLGRARLLALAGSDDAETRDLAKIWLDRIESRANTGGLPESELATLACDGVTARVRFEAWMSIGNRRYSESRQDEAIAAYRAALELAPVAGAEREAAQTSLALCTNAGLPMIGLGPEGSVITGTRTIQPRWREPRTARLEYRLDGRLVASADRSPFAAAVNFDRMPKRQQLEIRALDDAGRVLRSSSVVVNDRGDAFSIEIVAPVGETLSGTSTVELAVRVPGGGHVEDVRVEWNGAVVARLAAPPWRATVTAKGDAVGVMRAVARASDGSEREYVRLFNAGAVQIGSVVNLVEVPVYREGPELAAADFVVKEAGVARAVDRVIPASDAPLDVALLLDMSTSISRHVLDLEEGAIRLVDTILSDRNRVTLVAFDSAARVALWPTGERARLIGAIQALRVRGTTALHDAMITALLQLQGSGSRRALVVFSDGVDNASVFAMSDVLEVAKRSAVPVYVVTVHPVFQPPPGRDMPAIPRAVRAQKALAELARSSGGMEFRLQSVDRIGSIGESISEDLRRQSLVIYHTSGDEGGWRKIEVSTRSGVKLRAPSGVWVEGGPNASRQAE